MEILITVIAILLICADIIIVDLIARYSCDRNCPKLPSFLSQGLVGKKANSKKRFSKSRQRAEKLKETADIKFSITSSDNLNLVAHYYECEDAERLVIALHGWRSSWNYDFNGQYEFLHQQKCSILFTEARAHGESQGRYMYYGKKEYDDLKRWILFVRKNISPKLPIYLYGMSAGAAAAIMVSPELEGLGVYGIIADSASTSARGAGKMTIKNIHLSPLIFYSQVRLDCYIRLGIDDNEYTPLEAIKKCQVPILLICGTKDRLAPEFMSEKLYNNCPSKKKKIVFENAGHMKSYYTDTEKYQKALLDFFNANDPLSSKNQTC